MTEDHQTVLVLNLVGYPSNVVMLTAANEIVICTCVEKIPKTEEKGRKFPSNNSVISIQMMFVCYLEKGD